VIGDTVALAIRSLGHWADSALTPVFVSIHRAARAHRLFHDHAWIAPISQATLGLNLERLAT
jgi:hypothetical protein